MDDGFLARSWLFARIVAYIAVFINTVIGDVAGVDKDFVRINANSLSNEETESTVALVQTHSLVHARIKQAPYGQEANGQLSTGHEFEIPEVSKQVSRDFSNAERTLIEGSELLRHTKPLAWFYVSNTGDWLANTLIHLPGMCPKLPPYLVIDEKTFGRSMLENFTNHFPVEENCPGSMLKLAASEGVGTAYETQYKKHGIILMKQPERRLVDGYNDNLHDWPQWRMYPKNIRDYAEVVQGCTVKMLTRDGGDEVCSGPLPTEEEVETAMQRLKEGFVFVGLAEQLDLSVCLIHKMFGGVCQEAEFHTSTPVKNPSSGNKKKMGTLNDLGNFTDAYDGKLYKAALDLFQQSLAKYDVSQASCEWCFRSGWNSFFPVVDINSPFDTMPGPPIQINAGSPSPTITPSFPTDAGPSPRIIPASVPST